MRAVVHGDMALTVTAGGGLFLFAGHAHVGHIVRQL